ncbi:MAG: folate-binding protein [Burkholderiaceae bacterium]|nr:folate-binding protein [Burkholderiaceae bacterium]MDZ4144869.1 folate-binding protein [Burkholderiales bacterium]
MTATLHPSALAAEVLQGLTPLTHLGVIRVEGEDAAKFLHGQLTQDFVLLGANEARLAAFCSAKGRMQASFIGFKRSPTEILLLCHRDLLAPTLQRLTMFVLRAKARLSDATDQFRLHGLAGETIKIVANNDHLVWGKADFDSQNLIHLYPADGVPRALLVGPANVPLPPALATAPVLSSELWAWGEVRAGIATLSPPVAEAFVPQMLNYESVGGVNFKKGCYPGQEVVARSQFRGTLKRRAFVAHVARAEVAPAAGQEVFHSSDAEQPAGTVAQAAPAPGGGWDVIASLQLSATSGGTLNLAGPSGPAMTLAPLPYPLLADV